MKFRGYTPLKPLQKYFAHKKRFDKNEAFLRDFGSFVVRQCRAAGALRSRAFGVAAHQVGFLGGPWEAGWAEQPPLGPGPCVRS